MRFEDIRGNDDVKQALSAMIDAGKFSHAIMFHEDEGSGALPLCLAFLQYLMCRDRGEGDSCGHCPVCHKISALIHPDVRFVFPATSGTIIPAKLKPTSLSYSAEWRQLVTSNPLFSEYDLYEAIGVEAKSAMITVGDARQVLDFLSLRSLEGGYRAVVIYLPEKMNAEAANKLLKSIEEPAEKTQFLFVTHNPEMVLQTISSRCQTIRLKPVRQNSPKALEDITAEKELFMDLVKAVTAKDLVAALEVGDKIIALPSKLKQKSFIATSVAMLRSILMTRQKMEAIAFTDEADAQFVRDAAASLPKAFVRQIVPVFDRAVMMIERNVNPKMVLTDLVNKFFVAGLK